MQMEGSGRRVLEAATQRRRGNQGRRRSAGQDIRWPQPATDATPRSTADSTPRSERPSSMAGRTSLGNLRTALPVLRPSIRPRSTLLKLSRKHRPASARPCPAATPSGLRGVHATARGHPRELVPSDSERRTIYALSTPPGKAGVAVVRVSGPDALQVWRNIVKPRVEGKGKVRERVRCRGRCTVAVLCTRSLGRC